jgi:mevalonate kinase
MLATAPAKLILCGEHAVVYGQPAIAVPLPDLRATATVQAGAPHTGLTLAVPDLSPELIHDPQHPLLALIHATLHTLAAPAAPDLLLTVRSSIPIASGMGSGAAVATALVRAVAQWYGVAITDATVSDLVYQSEQRLHGTPSGIDNAVIAYAQPIWFVRQSPAPLIEPIQIGAPLHLVIGDTGIRSETRLPVGAVRQAWQAQPAHYTALFAAVGDIVHEIRTILARPQPDLSLLGALLTANQHLLAQIGVSSPALERLISAARAAGALGAKLSGAGWGGIMLALATDSAHAAYLATMLRAAGAVQATPTVVQAHG